MEWSRYEDYLKSDVWAEKRYAALFYAGYRCQVCNGKHKLQVHHRTYERGWGNELPEDLTVLCCRCHNLFTKQQHQDKERRHRHRTKHHKPSKEVRTEKPLPTRFPFYERKGFVK